jgi:CBS domain-containing protein
MNADVVSVSPGATVFDAAELLVNNHLSAVPVIDDRGVMIGVVSEADLIRGAAKAAKSVGQHVLGKVDDDAHANAAIEASKMQRVADVMTRGAIAVHETATLREVAHLMLIHGIKRVPVIRDQAVLGMVSRADLLKALISFGAPAYAPIGASEKGPDPDLRAVVLAAVQGHAWSKALWCDAVTSGGIVHLWGVVPSDAIRQAYVGAVEQVEGVVDVRSHMHVGQTTPHMSG